jgi:RNA polymerase-interacting CarD/CdnL/TRCF family regulator
MMHKVDDKVVHLREGLSTIISITEIAGGQYFLLKVHRANCEDIFVPVETANNIIRSILTVEEADGILKTLQSVEKEFVVNTKQRRDGFKRKLSSGDVNDIAYLYYQSCLFEEDPEGVKLGPADIDMLNFASNMLLDELCLTYNKNRDEIAGFVRNRISII